MIRRLVPALILAALPLIAEAGDPLSYSFIEGQYLNTKLKDNSTTPATEDKYEGYRLGTNISVYKFIYFTGEADKRRAQKYRFGTQSVGLGGHTPTNMIPHLQAFGNATYERKTYNDVTGFKKDDTDEGYGVEAGVRAPFDNFEFSASYKYMNYGETNKVKFTGDRFGAMVAVQISPYFDLTGTYRRFDEIAKATGLNDKAQFDEYLVGFRTYFATSIDRWRRRGGLLGGGE